MIAVAAINFRCCHYIWRHCDVHLHIWDGDRDLGGSAKRASVPPPAAATDSKKIRGRMTVERRRRPAPFVYHYCPGS